MKIRTGWMIFVMTWLCGTTYLSAQANEDMANVSRKLPFQSLRLAPGFQMTVFSNNVPEARQMAVGDQGTVFVGSLKSGNVYALVDRTKDQVADMRYLIASGLNHPSGVAFKDGSLYVAEIHRIIRFDNIESSLRTPPQPITITTNLPKDEWNGARYIKFGPDGKLYVSVGAPCNVCERDDERYGTIMRLNPDGSEMEVYAKGIRHSLGFDWHPETNELWFTDISRNQMGTDVPPDELNRAAEPGMHFGFPYCHGKSLVDPDFGKADKKGQNCEGYTPAAYEFYAHTAPMGIHFYRGSTFPETFKNRLFIAEHGAKDREMTLGAQLGLMRFKSNNRYSYGITGMGWLQGDEAWGRPTDVVGLKDGSVLISDDEAGVIYRLYF